MDIKTLKDVVGASVIHALILSAGGSITVPRDVFNGATSTSLFMYQDFDTGAITYKVVKEP